MSESTGHYRNIFKLVNAPDQYLFIYRYSTGWPFLVSTDPIGPHKYEKRLTQVEYFKRIIQPHFTTEKLISLPKLLPENKIEQLITNLEIELHILGYPIFHHISGLRLGYNIESLTSSSSSASSIKVSTPIIEQLCPHLLELPIRKQDQELIEAAIKESDRIIVKAAKNREAVKKSTASKPLAVLEEVVKIEEEAETTTNKIDALLDQHNKALNPTQSQIVEEIDNLFLNMPSTPGN